MAKLKPIPKIESSLLEELEGLPAQSIENIVSNGLADRRNDSRPLQPGSWLYMLGYSIDEDSLLDQVLKQLIK